MTTKEVGAYFLLLCMAWNETPPATIPADDRTLAAWAKMTDEEWRESRLVVLAPFDATTDNRLVQKRLRAEYDRAVVKLRAQREAGKRGAASRWQPHSDPMATPLRPHCDGNAKISVSVRETETPPTPPVGGRGVGSLVESVPLSGVLQRAKAPPLPRGAFPTQAECAEAVRAAQALWPAHRRQASRRAEHALWDAVRTCADADGISDPAGARALLGRFSVRAAEYAQSQQAQGKWCPLLATWIADRRWDDDPAAWRDGSAEPTANEKRAKREAAHRRCVAACAEKLRGLIAGGVDRERVEQEALMAARSVAGTSFAAREIADLALREVYGSAAGVTA